MARWGLVWPKGATYTLFGKNVSVLYVIASQRNSTAPRQAVKADGADDPQVAILNPTWDMTPWWVMRNELIL